MTDMSKDKNKKQFMKHDEMEILDQVINFYEALFKN